jgi:hypothetical protein
MWIADQSAEASLALPDGLAILLGFTCLVHVADDHKVVVQRRARVRVVVGLVRIAIGGSMR